MIRFISPLQNMLVNRSFRQGYICKTIRSKFDLRHSFVLSENQLHRSHSTETISPDEFHLPFWKAGSGHYGNTLGNNTILIAKASQDLALSFVDTIPVNKDRVFTLADYGTNDGYASMPLMTRIIGHLRSKYGEHLPIQVIYEDQTKNDFNSLFNRLSADTSFMAQAKNVYPFVTNISFYEQSVPSGTCDFIFTNCAAHILSKQHFKFKNNISHMTAPEEELRQFRATAEQDWVNFLVLRAKELKTGGILVASNLSASEHSGADTQGTSTPKNSEGENRTEPTEKRSSTRNQLVDFTVDNLGITMQDVCFDLEAAWKQLRMGNMITQEELENCTINFWIRKGTEWRSPFDAVNSPVRAAGLSLIHHDQVFQRCSFKNKWWQKLLKEDIDDRQYFAEMLMKAHQVWSRTTFEKSLSDARSSEEKSAILDRLYQIASEIVASKDPHTYKCDIVISRLVARKN